MNKRDEQSQTNPSESAEQWRIMGEPQAEPPESSESPEPPPPPGGAAGEGPSEASNEAADPSAEPSEPEAELTLEGLQQERDELEQKLLRVSADYRNYQRRAQQNVTTAQQQQLMEVAKSLVTVLDHFDHALQVDPQSTSPEKMMEGVEMVRGELLGVLNQHGVARIEAAVGEPFDPNRHEAMMRQPTDQVEPDHVAAQIQPGYVLNDKTIRPAKVAVAQSPE